MLKANAPELLFSVDMDKWVAEAVAVDSTTARITLNAPNPRFVFSYFTHNGRQGFSFTHNGRRGFFIFTHNKKWGFSTFTHNGIRGFSTYTDNAR